MNAKDLQEHVADFVKVEFGLDEKDNSLKHFRKADNIWDRNLWLDHIVGKHALCDEIKHYIEGMLHMVEAFDKSNCIGTYA